MFKFKPITMANTAYDIKAIKWALKEAAKHDLEIEVILGALQYIQEHPKHTIELAMKFGLSDWDVRVLSMNDWAKYSELIED